MGQIGGQEESRVGRVEGPVSSDQAGQCGGVSVTEQLQTVTMQTVQIGQLEESLGGVINQWLVIKYYRCNSPLSSKSIGEVMCMGAFSGYFIWYTQ